MIKVYMESGIHAEVVALFPNEDLYSVCADALSDAAHEANMFTTESVMDEVDFDKDVVPYTESYEYYDLEDLKTKGNKLLTDLQKLVEQLPDKGLTSAECQRRYILNNIQNVEQALTGLEECDLKEEE